MAELQCAQTITELADLWCRMDAHEGQAAWAGAIGTVLAILASSVFAVLVPIHMHNRDERNRVQRAINVLIVGVGRSQAAIESGIAAAQSAATMKNAVGLIRTQIVAARSAFAQVPESMMLGQAFEGLATCDIQLHVLEEILSEVEHGASAAHVLPLIEEILPDVERVSIEIMALEPRRISGCWMMHAPKDDPDIEEAREVSAAARAKSAVRRG